MAELLTPKTRALNPKLGDGVQQPGEPGLPNWTVVVSGPNGAITGITDGNGNSCVEVPVGGTYTITEQLQPGWTPTTPPTVQVSVPYAHHVVFGNRRVGRCDLGVTKSVSPSPVVSGQQATVTITVTNLGTDNCRGPTTVKDVLPAGLTFVSASAPPGWTCSHTGGTVTCIYSGSLPAGSVSTITIRVNVTAKPGATLENCAEVINTNDTNPANNKHCIKIRVIEASTR